MRNRWNKIWEKSTHAVNLMIQNMFLYRFNISKFNILWIDLFVDAHWIWLCINGDRLNKMVRAWKHLFCGDNEMVMCLVWNSLTVSQRRFTDVLQYAEFGCSASMRTSLCDFCLDFYAWIQSAWFRCKVTLGLVEFVTIRDMPFRMSN